jgi:hypothetical protein
VNTSNDLVDIQALKTRYCAAVDQLPDQEAESVAKIRALLTEDMEGSGGGNIHRGREAVIDFLIYSVGRGHKWLWHSVHSPVIDVAGDQAKGQWTALVYMMEKHSPVVRQLIGRYVETYRRTSLGWRISASRWVPESVLDVSQQWGGAAQRPR